MRRALLALLVAVPSVALAVNPGWLKRPKCRFTPADTYSLDGSNLITTPEQIGGTGWTITGNTVTANQGTLPGAGTATMDQVVPLSNGASAYFTGTVTSGTGPFAHAQYARSASGTAEQSVIGACGGSQAVASCTCWRGDGGACSAFVSASINCVALASLGTTPVQLGVNWSCAGNVTTVYAAVRGGRMGSDNGIAGIFGGGWLQASGVTVGNTCAERFRPRFRLYSFNNSTNVLLAADGISTSEFPTAQTITYAPTAGHSVRDPSVRYDSATRTYWLAHTSSGTTTGSGQDSFDVASSTDGLAWTYVATISTGIGASAIATWSPEWFVDTDGTVYVLVAVKTATTASTIQLLRANDGTMTAFTNLGAITGTSITAGAIDPFMVKLGSTYYLASKDESALLISIASSSSIGSGYNTTVLANPATSVTSEAPILLQTPSGSWRLYYDRYANSSGIAWKESYALTPQAFTYSVERTVTAPWTARHGTIVRLP